MEWFRFAVSATCIIIGLFTFVVGVVGVYKFKFVMNRMHSAAILDTIGLLFIALGCIVSKHFDAVTIKIIFVVALLWLTCPISSHFIAKLEYITDENLNDEIINELDESEDIGDIDE